MRFGDFFVGQDKETMVQTIAALTGGQTSVEADLTSKDGSKTAYFFTGSRIDIAGTQWLVGIGINITERKRAEEEIRELSQRLSYHVENSPLAVIEWGPDMQLIRWSGEAEHIFGWRAEDVIGKHMEDFRWIYEEDGAQVAQVSSELKSGTNPQRFSANRNYRKDGAVIHCEWYNSSLMDDSGKLRSILSLVLDVTERKLMEEELRRARNNLEWHIHERTAELELANEKLRSVPSRLIAVQENERKRLAGELHDSIGQTLAALKFRIEHIITTLEKRESKQALQFLREFVPILQRSIDETRTIYMGLKPTVLSDHGILATLEWYRMELLKVYPNQHIEIETAIREGDIPEDLKITIFRIAQEALNNTLKHGKSEWVDVRIAVDDGAIELEISDDGIGMDLGYIIESSAARSLGLIGMRERTELTGGEFTIRSAPNEGTTIKAIWRNNFNIPPGDLLLANGN
jgi:PAS domain S-box-containing protein